MKLISETKKKFLNIQICRKILLESSPKMMSHVKTHHVIFLYENAYLLWLQNLYTPPHFNFNFRYVLLPRNKIVNKIENDAMWGQKNLPKNCVMDFFASQTISFRS